MNKKLVASGALAAAILALGYGSYNSYLKSCE